MEGDEPLPRRRRPRQVGLVLHLGVVEARRALGAEHEDAPLVPEPVVRTALEDLVREADAPGEVTLAVPGAGALGAGGRDGALGQRGDVLRRVGQPIGAAQPVREVVGGGHGGPGEDVPVVVGELAVLREGRLGDHQLGPRPQGGDGPPVRLALGTWELDDDPGVRDDAGDAAAERLIRMGRTAMGIEEDVQRIVGDLRARRQDAHRTGEEPALPAVRAVRLARLGAEDLAVLRQPVVEVDRAFLGVAVGEGAARRGQGQHPFRRDESSAGIVDLLSGLDGQPGLPPPPAEGDHGCQTQQHVHGLAHPARHGHRSPGSPPTARRN